MLRRPNYSYFSLLVAVRFSRPLFYTGGALLLFGASAFVHFRGSMSPKLRTNDAALAAGYPAGEFRRVRAATKGLRPLETRSLWKRLAKLLYVAYCLASLTLSLAPSLLRTKD